MGRYIDTDKLKKKKKYSFQTNFGAFPKHEYFIKLQDLLEAPTADVEDVRHGKWLFVVGNCKEEIWMCDQCERCIRSEQMKKDELIKRYPYCHCGAKMDKDKEK